MLKIERYKGFDSIIPADWDDMIWAYRNGRILSYEKNMKVKPQTFLYLLHDNYWIGYNIIKYWQVNKPNNYYTPYYTPCIAFGNPFIDIAFPGQKLFPNSIALNRPTPSLPLPLQKWELDGGRI